MRWSACIVKCVTARIGITVLLHATARVISHQHTHTLYIHKHTTYTFACSHTRAAHSAGMANRILCSGSASLGACAGKPATGHVRLQKRAQNRAAAAAAQWAHFYTPIMFAACTSWRVRPHPARTQIERAACLGFAPWGVWIATRQMEWFNCVCQHTKNNRSLACALSDCGQ